MIDGNATALSKTDRVTRNWRNCQSATINKMGASRELQHYFGNSFTSKVIAASKTASEVRPDFSIELSDPNYFVIYDL